MSSIFAPPFGTSGWCFFAQVVRSSLQGVVTDPPTPPRVTVDFSDAGVDADGDGELTYVGTESRPEAVEGTGLVDGADVNGGPVANRVPVFTKRSTSAATTMSPAIAAADFFADGLVAILERLTAHAFLDNLTDDQVIGLRGLDVLLPSVSARTGRRFLNGLLKQRRKVIGVRDSTKRQCCTNGNLNSEWEVGRVSQIRDGLRRVGRGRRPDGHR